MTFAAYSRCSISSTVRVHCRAGLCDLLGPTGHGVDITIASARNGKLVLSLTAMRVVSCRYHFVSR